jgi:DNA-binding MarR family transcriptional regulator
MTPTENDDLQGVIHQIAGSCIAVRTRLINRVITSIFDEALRSLGVKVSQMNILVAVSLFGPIQPSAMSKALQLGPSTLSRNIDRMKAKGWIETHSCEDGRAHTIGVTPQGLDMIRAALPAWKIAQDRASAILGSQGVEVITEIGNRLFFSPAEVE